MTERQDAPSAPLDGHTIDVGYVHVLRSDTPEGVRVCVDNCPHPIHAEVEPYDGPVFYDPEVTSHE